MKTDKACLNFFEKIKPLRIPSSDIVTPLNVCVIFGIFIGTFVGFLTNRVCEMFDGDVPDIVDTNVPKFNT